MDGNEFCDKLAWFTRDPLKGTIEYSMLRRTGVVHIGAACERVNLEMRIAI